MDSAHLDDRAVIALAGPQARELLQGLITNDLARLAPGSAIYAALLTPQGKIVTDFLIVEGDGALLLDTPAAAAEALMKKLKLYRLRAKVEIEPRPQLAVYVGLQDVAAAISFADPRLAALGPRSIGARAEMPAGLPGAGAYHAARLELGVPEGADFGSDKIFALDSGLDELHAIAFDKGCYVGQELTARMKHRGTARKRLLVVEAQAPLPAGADISDGAASMGEVISSYGAKAFALIRLDRLESAGSALTAAGIPVTLHRPDWLG